MNEIFQIDTYALRNCKRKFLDKHKKRKEERKDDPNMCMNLFEKKDFS